MTFFRFKIACFSRLLGIAFGEHTGQSVSSHRDHASRFIGIRKCPLVLWHKIARHANFALGSSRMA